MKSNQSDHMIVMTKIPRTRHLYVTRQLDTRTVCFWFYEQITDKSRYRWKGSSRHMHLTFEPIRNTRNNISVLIVYISVRQISGTIKNIHTWETILVSNPPEVKDVSYFYKLNRGKYVKGLTFQMKVQLYYLSQNVHTLTDEN